MQICGFVVLFTSTRILLDMVNVAHSTRYNLYVCVTTSELHDLEYHARLLVFGRFIELYLIKFLQLSSKF